MNKDPGLINKNTKILVKLLAEIINDFIEPLSYKTMVFSGILLLCFVFLFKQKSVTKWLIKPN